MELLTKLWLQPCQSYSTLFYFLLCMLLFASKSSTAVALSTGNETDRLALLALRQSITEDPLNIMSSWNDSVHFCYWQGVSCSKRHSGRVTVLHLVHKKLAGILPPHIGNLSFLSRINLGENFFGGKITQEMGRLFRLRYLNLSNNIVQGEIPRSLSNCSNLRGIYLNYNKLVGEIPVELSYFLSNNLDGLGVFGNNLTGSIPIWLGNATSLVILSLGDNNFHGTIPSELGRLLNLRLLDLYGNNLSGTVPPPIYNHSSLLALDIMNNHLHGRIPSDIGSTLFNLRGLYVGLNYFSGSLPSSLSNASGLEDLSFGGSNFTGTVPLNLGSLKNLTRLSFGLNYLENEDGEELINFLTSLTNCSKLQVLDIGYNKFKGELPNSIANFSNALWFLSVGVNQISGTIPEGIEALVGLQYFVIYSNMITGKIPTGIGKLRVLKKVLMYENRISGSIPSSLGNITQLLGIYLDTNNLEGNIPPSLGNCQQLEILSLSGNKLTGTIPMEIVSLTSIHSFNLSQNFLTGELPPEVGNMSKLVELYISENRFSGEIPHSIGRCEMLEQLFLGNNSFEGSIPSTLSNLKSLKAIDLSKNNLSGKIPIFLENFTLLRYLNLSYNNFEGEIPQEGIFRNQSTFSIVGNKKVCGGLKSLGLPSCQVDVPKRKGVSLVLKIAIPVAISCSILLASLYLGFMWRRKTRAKSSSKGFFDEHFPKVSFAELSQATNKFSSSNLIGRGSHGSVYRGFLSNLGMTVAVKVLNLMQKGAAKSFMAECNALRNIRHRNLLKIITACSSIDFKGDDFKALVFEFMPNGSLEEWLHHSENSQLRLENLSLTQRLSIATDIAYALEYLHHQGETPIVHGDLKPSNILLDHEMTAHVGDFGLARVLSNHLNENSSQNPTSSTGLKGTVGYVAPEYGTGGRLSLQGDIYSFGIMLLEIFTCKRPTDDTFKNNMDLHQHVKMALPERVTEIVEPSILSNAEDIGNNSNNTERRAAEIDKIVECVIAILRIGVSCSMESPGERMSMKDVAIEMNKIKGKYNGITNRNGDDNE